MPMLGDVLAAARRSSGAFVDWLEVEDRGLAAEVGDAARQAGEAPSDYVRGAVADFGRLASEEDWAMLTSRLRDSEEPGTVCLLTMVRWRLSAEGDAQRAALTGGCAR